MAKESNFVFTLADRVFRVRKDDDGFHLHWGFGAFIATLEAKTDFLAGVEAAKRLFTLLTKKRKP